MSNNVARQLKLKLNIKLIKRIRRFVDFDKPPY